MPANATLYYIFKVFVVKEAAHSAYKKWCYTIQMTNDKTIHMQTKSPMIGQYTFYLTNSRPVWRHFYRHPFFIFFVIIWIGYRSNLSTLQQLADTFPKTNLYFVLGWCFGSFVAYKINTSLANLPTYGKLMYFFATSYSTIHFVCMSVRQSSH